MIASGLAFGAVAQILRSGRTVLGLLGDRPSENLRSPRAAEGLSGFSHRWVRGGDVALLLRTVARMLGDWGSVEAFFAEGEGSGLGARISSFSRRAKEIAKREGDPTRGFRYLFPEPARGGAAKRLCMFLRWMVRPDDGIDLGVWSCLDPADLVIPMDTHVLRAAQGLGLTGRKTATWRTALEVTEGLRRLSPGDPTRYDFALARLGISRDCLHRPDPDLCPRCALEGVCAYGDVPTDRSPS